MLAESHTILKTYSGGYVTTHSVVRNGRVFNVQLHAIQQEYPTVETWNSCKFQSQLGPYEANHGIMLDENKTINDYVVLGRDYLKQYN